MIAMNKCPNVSECACPKTTCPNHSRCCECVIKHRTTDSLPFCLFPDNGGDKSNQNHYEVLKKRFEINDKIGGSRIMKKPVVDLKRCFASKDVCMAIKSCPFKAVSYIEAAEPILDKNLKCNCNEREALGLTPMSVKGYSGGCDCAGGCGSGDDLYSCGGTPYGRIIIDYDKCTGCGLCAKECCGSCIDMIDEKAADKEEIRGHIRGRYVKIAKREVASCCSGSCDCSGTASDIAAVSKKLGYSEQDFFDAPYESNMGLGCGNPIAIASLKEGEAVLDLGSGGGFDCFIARKRVGETGFVIGVDMTPDMITLARKNAQKSGYKNVEFRLGEIEHLPVADSSVDVIISNCVINLSVDKEQVFKEALRVLKPGGRLSISDVVAIAEIPDAFRSDEGMISGCMGGAEHIDKIKVMLESAGYSDIKITLKDNSKEIIASWAPGTHIEDYVASAIIEAKKAGCCCGGKC